MPSYFPRPLAILFSIISILSVSACADRVDTNCVVTKGSVIDVKGINSEGTEATGTEKPMFHFVTFKYELENHEYEGSQMVSVNERRQYRTGESVELKIDKRNPSLAHLVLPPESPDRTGIKWRRMPEALPHGLSR